MSIKSFAAQLFANHIHKKTQSWANNPVETQRNVFQELIHQA